jgi:hypothetical protein
VGAAAWLTLTTRPATVTAALRAPPEFEATDTVAVPEPLPLPLTPAHAVPDEDVQLQPAVVVTETDAVLAPAWKLKEVGETV